LVRTAKCHPMFLVLPPDQTGRRRFGSQARFEISNALCSVI
jgi:hypothetical protein